MSVASVLRISSRCTSATSKKTLQAGSLPRSFSVLGPKRLGTPITHLGSALKAPTNASQQDPYTLLGIKKSASQSEIKKAYYALAKQYHPDTNKDPAARE
ncbi:hypothetical protein BGZ52_011597, partial [Haplosporangium bisporale]